MAIQFLAVLSFVSATFVGGIRVDIAKDVRQTSGTRAEIECSVSDTTGRLEECDFYGPGGIRFRERADPRDGLRVERDSRNDECRLTFTVLSAAHAGLWKCVAYDGYDEASAYAIVRVHERAAPLQLLLDDDEKRLQVQTGDNVQLLCPTNAVARNPHERPLCKFYDPSGKRYDVIGRSGEFYTYESDGIERAGDADGGECGIVINNIQFRQSGVWSCEVVRKNRPGSSARGSEIARTDLKIDVYRTARANDELQVQGQYVGDQRVYIDMVVAIDPKKEENVDFFWLVRRRLMIYEGDNCETDGQRQTCYTAFWREKTDEENTYLLTLEIDELFREDLEDPIVLVKTFTLPGSKTDDRMEKVYKVPLRSTNGLSSDQNSAEFGRLSERQDRSAQQARTLFKDFSGASKNSGEGCRVRNQVVGPGKSIEFPQMCVRVICTENGSIDLRPMSQSSCRRRRTSKRD